MCSDFSARTINCVEFPQLKKPGRYGSGTWMTVAVYDGEQRHRPEWPSISTKRSTS